MISSSSVIMVDIWWYGQSCFKIKGKDASLVVDPFSGEATGLAEPKLEASIVCVTHSHADHNNQALVSGAGDKEAFVINGPGEYEINGVNIVGIESWHDEKEGAERGKNTIYNIVIDDVSIVHLGDLGEKKLTQVQLDMMSECDVLLIPVGGTYTIEAQDAPDLIAQLEAKIVVPMHYKIDKLTYELAPVGDFLKAVGRENVEKLPKLSVSRDRLPTETEIVLLEVS